MYQQSEQRRESDFVKTQNKAKLWNILQNNGTFNNIDNTFFTKVREDFEYTILEIEKEHKQKSTIQKSKLFIDNMLEKVKNYKHVPNINRQYETNSNFAGQVSAVGQISAVGQGQGETQILQNDLPYTSESIKQSRMNAFENELNKKQSEFNEFNAKPQAPTADFSDKDTDDGDDVNKLLEKAMRERENLTIPTNQMPQDVKAEHVKAEKIEEQTETPQGNVSQTINTDTTPISSINNSGQNINFYNQEDMLMKIFEKLTKIEKYLKEEKETENLDLS